MTRRLLLGMALAALSASPAVAQVDVHASLSRTSAQVGETVELTIAASGTLTGLQRPEPPAVDHLEVVSSSSQQTVQMINGQFHATTTWVFGLRATREGTYTIPPIDVHVDGQTLSTQPLTLTVSGGGAPAGTAPAPQPAQPQPDERTPGEEQEAPPEDVFVTTEVDDRNPWVGQQVTLTLRFYRSHRVGLLGNAEYTPPATEGLVAEPLPDGPQRTEVLADTAFEVIEKRTALVAPTPGRYTIGPATITFRRSYIMGEETIETEPIALQVRALPTDGRPQGFCGVVGSLRAQMTAPPGELHVGEATTLRLTVTGSGNLRQLEAPEVTVEGDARVYHSGEQREIAPQPVDGGYALGGTVTFDYLLMPREAGTLTVKPVALHFFDPRTESYDAVETAALTLTVLPGPNGETSVESEGQELRYIHEDGPGLRRRSPVTSEAWFWVVQCIPLLALGWALRQRTELLRRARDPRYRRSIEAAPVARRALRRLAATASPRTVYERADAILSEYVAAKTGAAAASLSPQQARDLLLQAGVGAELADEVGQTLARLRAGVYAPGAAQAPVAAEARERLGDLVARLEAALR